MLKKLKSTVHKANLALVEHGLVLFTWGNVSGFDREKGLVVIKPSGVGYDKMKPEDMVVVDMDGKVVEGRLKPSSDLPTHLVLYKAFKNIGGIVHTHAEWSTAWAQAGECIPALGTTHADHFYGDIPCTGELTEQEINDDYEKETGKVIVETFKHKNPEQIPGVLVKSHGPFTWGNDPKDAVNNAVVMEEIAKIAYHSQMIKKVKSISQTLLDKHFLRKHGKDAYYGQ